MSIVTCQLGFSGEALAGATVINAVVMPDVPDANIRALMNAAVEM